MLTGCKPAWVYRLSVREWERLRLLREKKKTMPLISVIMGVHNSDSDMLLSAVRSVLSQSVSDIELIICDDGSENDIEKNA